MKPTQTRENLSDWDLVISSGRNIFNFPLADIWRFRDLLYMLVRREIVVLYKQTILGPLWFFIQPALTSIVYIVVFSRIAGISTDGLPPLLFYLAGSIIWSYFQESFNTTSQTFVQNASLFGKVYFPRIIVPLSKIISGLLRFLIQFLLFLLVYFFFLIRGYALQPNVTLLLVPLMVVIMAMLGLGMGIFFTSLTTRYRDLTFLIQFGVQLLMYATPVIYPLSSVPPAYQSWIHYNPMTPVMEGFRYAFLGIGSFSPYDLVPSFLTSTFILLLGLAIFNYVERDFMDTV